MVRGSQKRAKARKRPTDRKKSRTGLRRDPSSHDRETIVWAFSIVDEKGTWGCRGIPAQVWWSEILPKLQDFESMTWAAIMRASGGRTRGTNHHFVEVEKLTKQAKTRLAELKQDDVSELFSLRLDATKRIYGIRDRRALRLLWYDPYHGKNTQAVYPVQDR